VFSLEKIVASEIWIHSRYTAAISKGPLCAV
jgi:hypothetical protein